jgi:hypothetical protein
MSTGAVIRSRITTAHTIDATMTLSNNTPAWDVRLVATPYAGTSGGRAFTAPIVSSDGRPNLVMDSVTPASVELGGDPLSDRLTVAFTLQSAATMGVWLDDPTTNAQLAILRAPQQLVGTTSPRNWLVSLPPDLAPGSYYVRVGASSDPVPMRSMLRTLVTVTQAP